MRSEGVPDYEVRGGGGGVITTPMITIVYGSILPPASLYPRKKSES
jgi:hypothetical protein